MKASELKLEHVYICSNETGAIQALYYGMTEDKYTFIPYDSTRRHFCGAPFTLKEREVMNLIKPIA